MLLLMLTSGVALLLACGAFVAYERYSFRHTLTLKIESLAMIVGNASTAALEFKDSKVGREVLAALHKEQHITRAVIFDREGKTFALYMRNPEDQRALDPPARVDGHQFSETHLLLSRRIVL